LSNVDNRTDSFELFWWQYLREHGRPETRALHILGTILGLACLAAALVAYLRDRSPLLWLLGAALAGYGPAWIGHFAFEGNHPVAFARPFWSLRADLRMAALWATGGLKPHLQRAGVTSSS
jgi:hypothetical protein